MPFASEIARNLNEVGQIRVLPIVTPGATDNIRDLLFLKGVDVAITHTDVLEHFKSVEKMPNIDRRIRYITSLYASEIHVVVRPEIDSLHALAGKKVGFHTKGSGSTVTAPIIFQRLGIMVEPVYLSNTVALEKMRSGELAAIVHNGGKPNNLIARFRNDAGFKLLEIPIEKFDDYYLPAKLTAEDYPNFLKPGEQVQTIAVQAVLAVYNWPASSLRYPRIARFIDQLFDQFESFKGPGYQTQWKEINLTASVPGWERYGPAAAKLKKLPTPPLPSPVQAVRPGKASGLNYEAPQSPRFQQELNGGELALNALSGVPMIKSEERDLISGK